LLHLRTGTIPLCAFHVTNSVSLSLTHTHTIMFGQRVFREGRDHVSSVPLDCLEDPKWDFDLLGYKKRNSFKTM
jgi:hypothetical protein